MPKLHRSRFFLGIVWSLVLLSVWTTQGCAQEPWSAQRFAGIAEQSADWNCGPTAVVILVQLLGFEPPPMPDEQQNVNLADLQAWLSQAQIETAGYRIDEQLLWQFFQEDGFLPLILHYAEPDAHFATAVGVADDWILIADPRDGWQWLHQRQFVQQWSGYVLVPHMPRQEHRPQVIEIQQLRFDYLRTFF